jgi:hypothetical protein
MPGLRRSSSSEPRSVRWEGTPDSATRIAEWARNAALLARWQWSPGQEARVHVERPYPDSSEWVIVPVGAVIRRVAVDGLDEKDWPLKLEVKGESILS